MITLERVYLRNVRGIGEAEVCPLTDGGLTALNGPVGAGKSSVLDAIVWTLFGVTPDDVPVAGMRRQGSDGQECLAQVTFWMNGQKYVVERGLKGRGKKESTYVVAHINDVEQALGNVPAAQRWIIEQLSGLNAEAFLTVFAVRQKELVGLVKARPAERRKLIERLAGIERASDALEAARAETRDVQRRLDVLPGSAEDAAAARDALEAAQARAEHLWTVLEDAERAAAVASRALLEADQDATDIAAQIASAEAAEAAFRAADRNAATAEQHAALAAAELDRHRQAARSGSAEDMAATETEHTAAATAVQHCRDTINAAEHAHRAADTADAAHQAVAARAAAARRAADIAEVAADAAESAATGDPGHLTAQADAAAQAATGLANRVGALRGDYDRISKAIAALTATNRPCCPTCSTDLADPARLISELTTQLARVRDDGITVAADAASATEQSRAYRAAAAAAVAARRDAVEARRNATRLAHDAAAVETEHATASATCDAATSAAEAAAAAATQAHADLPGLERHLAVASRAWHAAQAAAEHRAALPVTEDRARAAASAAHDARAAADTAEAAHVAAYIPPARKEAVDAAHRAARVTEREAAEIHHNARAAFAVANEQVTAAERTRDTEDRKLRLRADTVADLEATTATSDALAAFRRDRIARLAPELSEIASDLLPAMTGGKFVAVDLDAEFTPVITDSVGRQRPVSMLSGGEEDSVALALRCAIREVVSGARGGMLFLDEVLPSQDEARRASTMAVIREIPGAQPIVINHVSEATDMVDLVLDVLPDLDNGSTIRPAALNSNVGALDAA